MEKKLEVAWRVRCANFPMEMGFTYPARTAIISLTGSWCALDCAHCGGHYLKAMMPIREARLGEATSCLISGGCDIWGRVPVLKHLDEVRRFKENRPHLRYNWHVGLIGEAETQAIAPYVDVISFDFVGDDETIREVYGLRRDAEDYLDTFRMLRRYTKVVPHVTLGLRGGHFSGEYRALEMLKDLGVEGLVVNVFRPTKGTRYAASSPPKVEEVVDFLISARLLLPQTSISLGCMRPNGIYRDLLDPEALRAGVNQIVQPSRRATQLASDLGMTIRHGEECCALEQG